MNPEETMVVVVSKTFTTAETMLNARTVRKWLIAQLGVYVCVCLCVYVCSWIESGQFVARNVQRWCVEVLF